MQLTTLYRKNTIIKKIIIPIIFLIIVITISLRQPENVPETASERTDINPNKVIHGLSSDRNIIGASNKEASYMNQATDSPRSDNIQIDSLFDQITAQDLKKIAEDMTRILRYREASLEYIKRQKMDPNVALLWSICELKNIYSRERDLLRNNYIRELRYASKQIAARYVGTSDWAEAKLYQGACLEADGVCAFYGSVPGGKNIVEFYDSILKASPAPDSSMERQLRYRIALHEFSALWESNAENSEQHARYNNVKKQLDSLKTENLQGVSTLLGLSMAHGYQTLENACHSDLNSFASVQARLVVLNELFPWPKSKRHAIPIRRSILKDLSGPAANDYTDYLHDPLVPSEDKAQLEYNLARLNRNPEDKLQHATAALQYATQEQVKLKSLAKIQLASANESAGQHSQALAYAQEVFKSDAFQLLDEENRKETSYIYYKNR